MFPFSKKRIEVSGGFWLLLAWFLLANGGRVGLALLGAAVIHEAGHYLTLKVTGGSVSRLRVNVFGAVMDVDESSMNYGQEMAVIAAGPLANFVCGLLFLPVVSEWDVLIGANIILGSFNLLPIRPLDGGRLLYLLVSWQADPMVGETVSRWVGAVCSVLLAAGLGVLMWCSGGSLWLLPPLVGVIGGMVREFLWKW